MSIAPAVKQPVPAVQSSGRWRAACQGLDRHLPGELPRGTVQPVHGDEAAFRPPIQQARSNSDLGKPGNFRSLSSFLLGTNTAVSEASNFLIVSPDLLSRICRMGQDTRTLAEIGEELIQLISETSAKTGLSVEQIANTVSRTTRIDFVLRDGKLNITEEALRAMELKMAYARAKCRALELRHIAIETETIPVGDTQASSSAASVSNTANDSIGAAASIAGYAIPTESEEQRIRQRYYKSRGHYRELHHPIWNELRSAVGTSMFSLPEMASFIHGASVRDIFAHRVSINGNIRSSTNGIPEKVDQPCAPAAEPFNPIEAFFSIPWYAWVGGFCLIIWLLAMSTTGGDRNIALERAQAKARSGRGAEMTAREADAFRRKQEADSAEHTARIKAVTEARQSRYSDRELEIYRYMRGRFLSYGDDYNPSIHDDLIASETASRFGVSASEATNIYIRIDAN
jgi:hypothetical protein